MPLPRLRLLKLSLSFLPFTTPFHHSMPLASTQCHIPPALPIPLRFGGDLWYRFYEDLSQTPIKSLALHKPPLSEVKARYL